MKLPRFGPRLFTGNTEIFGPPIYRPELPDLVAVIRGPIRGGAVILNGIRFDLASDPDLPPDVLELRSRQTGAPRARFTPP